ncbi:hypothetical protein RCH16_000576 [Cryobacterium sp. MP_M5]|uniref:hypothetical protein n=1 Tax=unclassified Cryobacterium TaxID=2649013 RepID=UPI0018CB35B1|nr:MULTISPECIES: hypothetical protein [unclassified Cryobacterium]MBG6057384.1 hypothetical protein [Cryobacterium sp. MP_M3]MEC5175583.1 hypothetical protein [Cryobacterium sp. MP_M5]
MKIWEALSADSFRALWATPARDAFSCTCALGYVAVTTICIESLAVLPWLASTGVGVVAAAALGSRWARQDRAGLSSTPDASGAVPDP